MVNTRSFHRITTRSMDQPPSKCTNNSIKMIRLAVKSKFMRRRLNIQRNFLNCQGFCGSKLARFSPSWQQVVRAKEKSLGLSLFTESPTRTTCGKSPSKNVDHFDSIPHVFESYSDFISKLWNWIVG